MQIVTKRTDNPTPNDEALATIEELHARLARPKYSIANDAERLQQLLEAAYSVYLVRCEMKEGQ
jgi:hypothetical protein